MDVCLNFRLIPVTSFNSVLREGMSPAANVYHFAVWRIDGLMRREGTNPRAMDFHVGFVCLALVSCFCAYPYEPREVLIVKGRGT